MQLSERLSNEGEGEHRLPPTDKVGLPAVPSLQPLEAFPGQLHLSPEELPSIQRLLLARLGDRGLNEQHHWAWDALRRPRLMREEKEQSDRREASEGGPSPEAPPDDIHIEPRERCHREGDSYRSDNTRCPHDLIEIDRVVSELNPAHA